MAIPAQHVPSHQISDLVAKQADALRMVMEWIADRFADTGDMDDSIDWEDGEERDEPHGSAVL